MVLKYLVNKDGVPILSKNEIEGITENIIFEYDPDALKRPKEIDIDSLAEFKFGLNIDFQYLSHNGIYLGAMIFNDAAVPVYIPEKNRAEYLNVKAGTIIIDNSLLADGQEHRYRYTVGHEVGHNILHRNCQANTIVQCREVNKFRSSNSKFWTSKDWSEWQANYFSSSILMPKKTVFMLAEKIKENKYPKEVSLVEAVIETYNVSWQAAENRLKSLGIIDNYMDTRFYKKVYDDFVI